MDQGNFPEGLSWFLCVGINCIPNFHDLWPPSFFLDVPWDYCALESPLVNIGSHEVSHALGEKTLSFLTLPLLLVFFCARKCAGLWVCPLVSGLPLILVHTAHSSSSQWPYRCRIHPLIPTLPLPAWFWVILWAFHSLLFHCSCYWLCSQKWFICWHNYRARYNYFQSNFQRTMRMPT